MFVKKNHPASQGGARDGKEQILRILSDYSWIENKLDLGIIESLYSGGDFSFRSLLGMPRRTHQHSAS